MMVIGTCYKDDKRKSWWKAIHKGGTLSTSNRKTLQVWYKKMVFAVSVTQQKSRYYEQIATKAWTGLGNIGVLNI